MDILWYPISIRFSQKTIYVLSAYKNKEIPELETNALKEALVITPEVIQNLEISFSKIEPNTSSEVKYQFSPRSFITVENNLEEPLSEKQKEYFSFINIPSISVYLLFVPIRVYLCSLKR